MIKARRGAHGTNNQTSGAKKSRIAAAISFACVSNAKWPVSKNWILARNVASERLGTRRQEKAIVLSPRRQETWLMSPEIGLERRVERNVAFVAAKQVQLNLVGTRAGQIGIVKRIPVLRNLGSVSHTMRVLPAGRFGSKENAESLSLGRRGLLPARWDSAVTQPLFIGISVWEMIAVMRSECRTASRKPMGAP